ncbi:benzoate 4-monooxygenase cytochrome P450 [Xylaria curta]|nr:benzoate 4-monooxygenase cytochrome P450 [Xylaria curta]
MTDLIFLAALILGVAIHHGIFIHGEWHTQAPSIVTCHLVSFVILVAFNNHMSSKTLQQSVVKITLLSIVYLLGLFSSISVYRLFFHSLAAFPGPRSVAVSKVWHVWKCRDSKNHHVLDDWYRKYGTFVRTGPNEVTIFHPGALDYMDGPKSRNSRSDWYDVLFPKIFSIFSRDKEIHSERRKVWDAAMNSSSLSKYYTKLVRHVQIFENFISESAGQPIVINELVSWFTFDCMGDFGFGQDFGMMRERKWLDPIIYMHASWSLLGVFSPAIWVPRISFAFFPIGKAQDWFKALAFSESLLKTCLERDSDQVDIVSEFIRDYNKSKKEQIDYSKLSGDASVLLFTGTDTTASSLIIVLYFLARFPSHAKKIQEELETVDIRDVRALTSLPHLTSTINESMRLLPVALTTNPGSRVTPPEGLTIDGTFIPGGVKICTSRYVLGKLSSAYEEPESFIPERWYSRPELVKDRRAFAPFGIGRYGCVGKAIAMAQIRLVIACLLSKYSIAFAPGEGNGESVEKDMRDQTTANPGKLVLVLENRV